MVGVTMRWVMMVVLLMAGGGMPGCEGTKPKPPAVTSGRVNIGPARDYPAGTVSLKYLATHGMAIANDSGMVLAVRPICTHDQRLTEWEADINQFVCPKDESQYDLLGRVTQGPAKKPMAGVAASKNADGTLTVDLDALYGGAGSVGPRPTAK